MRDDFSENLSFLCSYYSSIADVCRRMGINRQQFNKYLSGESRPSRANMRKICDFFGVTEAEILLEPSQLHSMVAVRSHPSNSTTLGILFQNLEKVYQRSQDLSRYVGFYYRYFYSFGHHGKIFCTLGLIYESGGRFFWKNIELIRDSKSKKKSSKVNKYEGQYF